MRHLLQGLMLVWLVGPHAFAEERQQDERTGKVAAAKPDKPAWRVSLEVNGCYMDRDDPRSTTLSIHATLADGEEGGTGREEVTSTDSKVVRTFRSFGYKVQQSRNLLLIEVRVTEDISSTTAGRTTRTVSNRSRSVDSVSVGGKVTLDLGKDENTGSQHRFDITVLKQVEIPK